MTVILDELCEFIVDCLHRTAPIEDYETGYYSIRTTDIGKGWIDFDKANRVSKETYDKWTVRAVPTGDDIIMAREAPVGNVAYIPSDKKICLGQRTVHLRPDQTKIDSRYLVYLMLGDEIQGKFHGYSAGATVAHLNMSDIRNLVMPKLPSLPTQRKIGAVLSAYDDLIENNNCRIQILEEMAQAIYRQWFVEFKFPGHEDVPLVDSGTELGEIPEGWEFQPFSKLININPKLSVDKQVKKPYVGMNALSTNSMLIDLGLVEMRTGSSGAKFQNRDVLFPRITPSVENGKAGFVQFLDEGQIAMGSTEIIVFREKDLNPEYIYFLSRETDFRGTAINSMVGASGRQRVQPGCFDTYLVVKPPSRFLEKFAEIVTPMFECIHTLTKKNANLRATRDLLLPRLVSGEVDVSEIAISVGD